MIRNRDGIRNNPSPIVQILFLSIFLSACETEVKEPDSEQATQTVEVAIEETAGDMQKYLGVWNSDCGTDILNGNSKEFLYTLDTVSGNTVYGTVTVYDYSTVDCSKSVSSTPSTYSVLFTYVGSVAVDYEASGYRFKGSADELSVQVSSGSPYTTYAGFMNNFSEMKLSGTENFSIYDLTYK